MKHNLGLSFSVHIAHIDQFCISAHLCLFSHRECRKNKAKQVTLGKRVYFYIDLCYTRSQSWPWQRCGRVWSRSESGWSQKWRSKWRWRNSRLLTRPRRSSGVPTVRRRPFSTAVGIPATVIIPANKHTGLNTWNPARSQVWERHVPDMYWSCAKQYHNNCLSFSNSTGYYYKMIALLF